MNPTLIWAIFGLLLVLAEILTTSFVLLFFGVAALLVSLIKLLGYNHFALEILLFALFSLSGIFLFRRKMLQNFKSPRIHFSDASNKIVLSMDIPPHARAKITYQGALWTATNDSDSAMKAGDKVEITRTEGIELFLKPIEKIQK